MAQVNTIQLRVNLRKNNNEKSDSYGCLYPELDLNQTLSLRGLCDHIAQHGSIYTRDVIYGVLIKMSECLPELLSQGQPVKLDGLGTFYPSVESTKGGVATVAAAKEISPASLIEGIHVRFQPEGAKLDNITSRQFKQKCSLQWGNLVEVTGKDAKQNPIYKLTPISNPVVAPNPEP